MQVLILNFQVLGTEMFSKDFDDVSDVDQTDIEKILKVKLDIFLNFKLKYIWTDV